VSSDELDDQSDSEDVPIARNPLYSIDKTVTGADTAGNGLIDDAHDIIDYEIVVTNDGNVSLTVLGVADPLLGTLTGPTESLNDDDVLEVGETWTYTGSYAVTQADLDSNATEEPDNVEPGKIDNTVTVKIQDHGQKSASAQQDVVFDPAIDIEKRGEFNDENQDGFAQVGETISYEFEVTNIGNITLHNVNVTDPLVPTITCPSGNPIPSLGVDASEICDGDYTITQADIDAGQRYNVATADPDETDPVTSRRDRPRHRRRNGRSPTAFHLHRRQHLCGIRREPEELPVLHGDPAERAGRGLRRPL
jgi:uncharacterized repeat protein (TIGR01451 family)